MYRERERKISYSMEREIQSPGTKASFFGGSLIDQRKTNAMINNQSRQQREISHNFFWKAVQRFRLPGSESQITQNMISTQLQGQESSPQALNSGPGGKTRNSIQSRGLEKVKD